MTNIPFTLDSFDEEIMITATFIKLRNWFVTNGFEDYLHTDVWKDLSLMTIEELEANLTECLMRRRNLRNMGEI